MTRARSQPHPRPALAAALVLAAILAGAPARAGAATPPPGATIDVVRIQDVRGQLRFAAPPSVYEGDYLEVVNETDPAKVGPHTFSLVGPGWLPKTKRARGLCFSRHHVCRAIANWHGVAGEGPPTVNPVDAGPEGWSTMGNPFRVGDSWYTGMRPGASIVQQVSVDASLGPRTIYFMCAIHPEMQGRIEVLPSPVPGA
jgi:hypothetical protein